MWAPEAVAPRWWMTQGASTRSRITNMIRSSPATAGPNSALPTGGTGTVQSIRAVLSRVPDAATRIAAICACGQMHGTVLVDAEGRLTRDTAPLWNDKRTVPQVEAFSTRAPLDEAARITANAPAPAWPAFKLAWLMEHDPTAVDRAAHVLMPKDWINLNLTGIAAQDETEASLSYLMDRRSREWSPRMVELTGIPRRLLPSLRKPSDILGPLTQDAARLVGLPAGIPVLAGAGDYPMALIGSGALAPGTGSDVTGTSTILTLIQPEPVIADGISNVLSAAGLGEALPCWTQAAMPCAGRAAPSMTMPCPMPMWTPPPRDPFRGPMRCCFCLICPENASERIAIRARISSA